MLNWAVIFLVIAMVAAVLGFTTLAGVTIVAAKTVFYIFAVLFAISVLRYLSRGGNAS